MRVPGVLRRYGFTGPELVIWAVIAGVPTVLVLAGLIGVVFYVGPVGD